MTDGAGAGRSSTTRRSVPLAVLVEMRPKQWVKNLLVFVAPVSAGLIDQVGAAADAVAAFVAFCLVSSGTYVLNDVLDVEADRRHPTKRDRPIAAGDIAERSAWILGPALLAVGLAVGFLARWEVSVVAGAYVVVTLAYSFRLKHVPVVDIVAIAAGFVLRAVAGIAAINVPISNWFFIIAAFGSLMMAAGKRQAESTEMGDDGPTVRSTLATYSASYLAYLRSVTSGVVLVAYCLWAFEKAELSDAPLLFQLSIVPFAMGVLRYALLVDGGQGGAPEELAFRDRSLQLFGVAWAASFAAGIYLG